MRLSFLLTSLVTCTFVTAIPLGNDISKEKTPSKTDQTPSKPNSTKETASAHPSTLTVAGPYSCPPKQYKACCMSLEETSKELMHPVGELVPIVGGIAISSQVSFQCMFRHSHLSISKFEMLSHKTGCLNKHFIHTVTNIDNRQCYGTIEGSPHMQRSRIHTHVLWELIGGRFIILALQQPIINRFIRLE